MPKLLTITQQEKFILQTVSNSKHGLVQMPKLLTITQQEKFILQTVSKWKHGLVQMPTNKRENKLWTIFQSKYDLKETLSKPCSYPGMLLSNVLIWNTSNPEVKRAGGRLHIFPILSLTLSFSLIPCTQFRNQCPSGTL